MTARPEDRKVRLILSPTLVRLATVAELFYEDLAEVVISKDINFERYPYALDPRFTVHLVQSGFKYTARLSREVGTDVLSFLNKCPAALSEDIISISRPRPSVSLDKRVSIWRQFQDYTVLKESHVVDHTEDVRDAMRASRLCDICATPHQPNKTVAILERALANYPNQIWSCGPSDEDLYEYAFNKAGNRWVTVVDQYDGKNERVLLAIASTSILKPYNRPPTFMFTPEVFFGVSVPKARFECVESWANRQPLVDWLTSKCPVPYVEGIRITIMRMSFDQGSDVVSNVSIEHLFENHLKLRPSVAETTKRAEGTSAPTKGDADVDECRIHAYPDRGEQDNISTSVSRSEVLPVTATDVKVQLANLDSQARALAPFSTSDEIKQLFDGMSLLGPQDKGKGRAWPSNDLQALFDDLPAPSDQAVASHKEACVAGWLNGSRAMKPAGKLKTFGMDGPRYYILEPNAGATQGDRAARPEITPMPCTLPPPLPSEVDDSEVEAHPAAFNKPITCGDLSDESEDGTIFTVSSSSSIVALSRLETPTYINDLLEKPDHTTASTRLLRIMRDEKVKLDSSLGLKLLDVVQALKRGGELSSVDIDSDTAESEAVSELKTLQVSSFNKTSERLNEFAGMLNAIAEAVGVNLQDADEEGPKAETRKETWPAVTEHDQDKPIDSAGKNDKALKDRSWDELRFHFITEQHPAPKVDRALADNSIGRDGPAATAESGDNLAVSDPMTEPDLHSGDVQKLHDRLDAMEKRHAELRAELKNVGSASPPPAIVPPINFLNCKPFINYGTVPKPFASTLSSSKSANDQTTSIMRDLGAASNNQPGEQSRPVDSRALSVPEPLLKPVQSSVSDVNCGPCQKKSTAASGFKPAGEVPAPPEQSDAVQPPAVPAIYSISAIAPLPELPEYAPMVPDKTGLVPPSSAPAPTTAPTAETAPARPVDTRGGQAALAQRTDSQIRHAVPALARAAPPWRGPARPPVYIPARAPYSRISTLSHDNGVTDPGRAWGEDTYARPPLRSAFMRSLAAEHSPSGQMGPDRVSVPPVPPFPTVVGRPGFVPFGNSTSPITPFDHWSMGPPPAPTLPFFGPAPAVGPALENPFPVVPVPGGPTGVSSLGPMYNPVMPYPYPSWYDAPPFW